MNEFLKGNPAQEQWHNYAHNKEDASTESSLAEGRRCAATRHCDHVMLALSSDV